MFPAQPLSIGGVVDAGVSLYGSTFKRTLRISLLASIPYALVSLAMSMAMDDFNLAEDADPAAVTAAAEQMMNGVIIYILPMYFTICFMFAAVGRRLVTLARSEPVSDAADLLFGLKLMIPLTLMMLAYILLMTLGMLLLIVPGIILSVSLSLFMYVPIYEDRSVWSSLLRSHKLIWRGNWWRVAGALLIITILAMVVSGCFSILVGGFAVLKTTTDYTTIITLVEGLGTWVMMTLLTPLSAAMALVLYNDVVLRREGDDLDDRLAELDSNTLEA